MKNNQTHTPGPDECANCGAIGMTTTSRPGNALRRLSSISVHTKFSLAALKRRLTVGTVIYCTQNVKGPQDPPLYRRVVIQQNNAIACATKPESVGLVVKRSDLYWLYWPKKAASVRPIPGGFELDNDLHPDGFKLRYQFEVKP